MDLSIRAQAILAGHWGFNPKASLTLKNVEKRLTPENAQAMSELIVAGIVQAEKADDGHPKSVTYTLTEKGQARKIAKSMNWMAEHGRFSLVEDIVSPASD